MSVFLALGPGSGAARTAAEGTASESVIELSRRCRSEVEPPREAVALCSRALAVEGRRIERASLLVVRGWHQRRAGSDRQAMSDFDAAIALVPSSYGARRGRAVTLSDLGRYREAERELDRLLRDYETRAVLYLDRGSVRARSGRAAEAAADYSAAIALEPAGVDGRRLRGLLAHERGDHDAALADFDAALAHDPGHAGLHHWRGVALSAKGAHRDAVSAFNRALATNPRAIGSLLERGKALEQIGEHSRALRSYERGLKIAPRHDLLLFQKAHVLSRLGRRDEAIAAYAAAVEVDPADRASLSNRALLLLEAGRQAEALRDAQRAVSLAPRDGQARYVRGLIRFEQGELVQADRDLTRALALGRSPTARLHNTRGRALLRLKRFREAARDFDSVIRLHPGALYGYFNRGLAAEGLRRWDEALGFYQKALSIEPGEPDSIRKRAEMLGKLGRHSESWRLRWVEAWQALRRTVLAARATKPPVAPELSPADRLGRLDAVLELDPFDEASRMRRAQLLAGQAATRARAREDLDLVLAEDPLHVDALVERARVHYDDGRFPDTIADAERALAIAPRDSDALFWRARALARLSRREEAVADYTRAIALDPRSKAARFNRGLLHRAAGRLDLAEADFSEAARLRPEQSDSWRYRGLVRISQKRFAEARGELEQALRLSPDHVGATIDLGNALYRAGDHAAAERHLGAALARGLTNVTIWNNRCYYRLLLRAFDAARADCAEALKLDPERSSALHSLGVMTLHNGEPEAAIGFFDRSIARDPASAFAHYGRAIALLRTGRADLAGEALARARALDPEIDELYRETGLAP